jgi:hypothetical protein
MQPIVLCVVLTILSQCTAKAVKKHNANLNNLNTVFHPNSSCIDALDYSVRATTVIQSLKNRSLLVRPAGNVTLLAVNFGPGSTATHALHEVMMIVFPLKQVHHYYKGYADVVHLIRQCLGISKGIDFGPKYNDIRTGVDDPLKCTSSYIISRLADVTEDILTSSKFISDTPMSALFSDLVLAAPHILATSTYRGWKSYKKSRMNHHNDDVLCKPALWSHPTVLHPFDIVACLRLKYKASEALDYAAKLKSGLYELAYKKQNSVNTIIASTYTKHLLPICLEDMDRNQSTDLLTKDVITYFAETNTSWGCPHKNNINNFNCTNIKPKNKNK